MLILTFCFFFFKFGFDKLVTNTNKTNLHTLEIHIILYFKYFCTAGPVCPAGYDWVPGLGAGRTCLKIGELPGNGLNRPDVNSGMYRMFTRL